MTNDEIDKLGFCSDNPYYSALRENRLAAGLSPAATATEVITELMSPKRYGQKSERDSHLFVIAHWRDAASLLLEGPCPLDRRSASAHLENKYHGLKRAMKLRRLAQLPEFIVSDIGPDLEIGKGALPLRKQIKGIASLKELNAYLPRRARCIFFDASSVSASTSTDARRGRVQQRRILKQSKMLVDLFAEIGELPMASLFDIRTSGVRWSAHSGQPCDLAAVQMITAAFEYYCEFAEQKKLFQHV